MIKIIKIIKVLAMLMICFMGLAFALGLASGVAHNLSEVQLAVASWGIVLVIVLMGLAGLAYCLKRGR